jgi:hypothetical protein
MDTCGQLAKQFAEVTRVCGDATNEYSGLRDEVESMLFHFVPLLMLLMFFLGILLGMILAKSEMKMTAKKTEKKKGLIKDAIKDAMKKDVNA